MLAFKKKILFFLFFVIVAIGAFASGKGEDPMIDAARLIEEKKYDDAVKILAAVVEKDPERFDEVEKLMAIIRNARNLYITYYGELLQFLRKEDFSDEDIETAYQLISNMKELEPEPDKLVEGLFVQAEKSIVFMRNNLQFENIMDRALQLIEEKKYWEAIALYSEAAGLHRESFAENYPPDILTEADGLTASVKILIDILGENRAFYESVEIKGIAESSDISEQALKLNMYNDLVDAIKTMAETREEAAKYAIALEKRKNQLLKEGALDIPMLSILNRIIMGRKSSIKEEGLLAAVDYLWDNTISLCARPLAEKRDSIFSNGVTNFNNKLYAEAENNFSMAKTYGDAEFFLISLKGYSISPSSGFNLAFIDIKKATKYLPEYLDSRDRIKAAADYASLSAIMVKVTEIEEKYPTAISFAAILKYRNQVVADNISIVAKKENWTVESEVLTDISNIGISVKPTLQLSKEMEKVLGNLDVLLGTLTASILREGVDIVYQPLSNNIEKYKADAETAYEMVDGISVATGEGDYVVTTTMKYPANASAIFSDTLSAIEDDNKTLRELTVLIDELQEENPSSLLGESAGRVKNDIVVIADMEKKIGQYVVTAKKLLIQADVYKNQAERYLGATKASLNKNDFDSARTNLQSAREGYSNSFQYNEDPALQESSDNEILAFSDEILAMQTALVIETVRKNLEQAKSLYAREQFSNAENILLSSQTMWNIINIEDNVEVNYWLNLVQTALSILSGRVITETDPLYNEMTQVLNLAKNDYSNAVVSKDNSMQQDMLNYLASAEDKIRYIIIPFPVNQEASILFLKIQKLKDEKNFEIMFKERFDLAMEGADINPKDTYITLKDLQAINPDYLGIKNAIYNIEIKLGIRVSPPNPAKMREAETLFLNALEIVNSNVRSNYPLAAAYLDNAFALNPDDSKITTLKDRVQVEMGGSATIVLSNYDQQQYRLSEQEFINGNYYTSLAIVENLMQNKKNRAYPPLIELKRRIDSRI